jgi:hypothetical protein
VEQLLAIQISANLKVFDRLIHPARKEIPDFKLSPFCECCIFLLGDSPASEFYVPTFRNTLSHLHRVHKRRHIKFRRRGITQKKEYNIV